MITHIIHQMEQSRLLNLPSDLIVILLQILDPLDLKMLILTTKEFFIYRKIKHLRNLQIVKNYDICQNAAFKGSLNILIWAHENDCFCDVLTCKYAAKGGHLNVLKQEYILGKFWQPSKNYLIIILI